MRRERGSKESKPTLGLKGTSRKIRVYNIGRNHVVSLAAVMGNLALEDCIVQLLISPPFIKPSYQTYTSISSNW